MPGQFEDGEHKTRPLDPVGGADVYVVQSPHGGPSESANDKLCRLLFFIGALKDAGAARVTAVVRYLCYSQRDRRTKPNDPVITRYVASLFEAVGTDVAVALDVHNPAAFENAFGCRTVSLTAAPLFLDYVKALTGDRLCVVSPDPGVSSAPNSSVKPWKRLSIGRSAKDLRTSIAVVASSLATYSLEMWQDRRH